MDSVYKRVSEVVISQTGIIRDLSDVVLMYSNILPDDNRVAVTSYRTIYASAAKICTERLAIFDIDVKEDQEKYPFMIMIHVTITPLIMTRAVTETVLTYIKTPIRLPFGNKAVCELQHGSECTYLPNGQITAIISIDSITNPNCIQFIKELQWEIKFDSEWVVIVNAPDTINCLTMQYYGFSRNQTFTSFVLADITHTGYVALFKFVRTSATTFELWMHCNPYDRSHYTIAPLRIKT